MCVLQQREVMLCDTSFEAITRTGMVQLRELTWIRALEFQLSYPRLLKSFSCPESRRDVVTS